ncbi:MAG: amidohydrolase family protein [Leucobacter sp.]
MSDLPRLLETQERLGIDVRVLGAPPALITPHGGRLDSKELLAFNEGIAEAVRAFPDRLAGLATINAFTGDEGAELVERSVSELGLDGIIIDCAEGTRLLDSPEARPVLEATARAGVPVLMHPVSLPPLAELLPGLEDWTETLARGTTTAASLIALMRSGTLDEIPGLHLVMPWMGGVGLVLAGLHDGVDQLRAGAPADRRWHVHVDTMGLEPHAIRYAVDLLDAEHVVMGSDWPIMSGSTSRSTVDSALSRAGVGDEAADLIRSGNAERLLKRATTPSSR